MTFYLHGDLFAEKLFAVIWILFAPSNLHNEKLWVVEILAPFSFTNFIDAYTIPGFNFLDSSYE